MELLIVVAIIALLVGLVIVSMHTVRASASRTDSLGALRQMSMAYARYTEDNKGRLMPGYIDTGLLQPGGDLEDIRVKLPSGEVLELEDTQSYVWRLAPYVDNAWQTFFADIDRGALSQFNADFGSNVYGPYGTGDPLLGISVRPAYGMNSIFVGGDSFHGGQYARAHSPWNTLDNKPIAATRLSEVKNPSRLIVFGPAALVAADTAAVYEKPGVGFCELRAPYLFKDSSDTWTLDQWMVGRQGRVQQTSNGEYADPAGLPIDRSGKDLMPVAHLDGSTVVEQLSSLSRDMRRWSPFEVGMYPTVDPSPR
jgi:type II secretory pathway pseudopilin PulG